MRLLTALFLAFLSHQYTSGFNRICVYEGNSGQTAITISVNSLCPLSISE